MKKLLIAATAVLVSSSPLILLPMEKELTLTSKQVQKLAQNTTVSLSQFKQIPKNPRTVTSILTYKNKDLTEFKTSIQADTKLSISAIFWNAKGEPVFQLQDITKQIWDYFFLNWHWILKSKLFDGTANLLAHA